MSSGWFVRSSRLAVSAVCLAGLILTTSCRQSVLPSSAQTDAVLRGNTLADAKHLLKKSRGLNNLGKVATVYQLRAAEIAWNQLDTDGGSIKQISKLNHSQQEALHVLKTATEQISQEFVGSDHEQTKSFEHAGLSYVIHTAPHSSRETHSFADFEAIKPAHFVKRKLCRDWHEEEGVGAPLASKWRRPADLKLQRFVSSRTYLQPTTALLSFERAKQGESNKKVSLTCYDPTYVSKVKLGATEYPIAADFTAPIVEQTSDIKQIKIALQGLIHPGEIDAKLIALQPYDPNRIPVLFIHGLNSHPRMWKDVINDLRADPQLRSRYQFMLFYYPTAWPISYSSMRLREELAAWEDTVGTPKKMVLVGHSMGGLLSRMQVIDPQRKLWDDQFGSKKDDLYHKLPSEHLSKRMLLFSPDQDIQREVYVCTPHRGSRLADLSITSWFIKLLKLPSNITGAFIDIPSNIISQGRLTSVAGLSPTNPLFKSMEEIPIRVPHHSIIGDRGKGNGKSSSDGVVAYSSSHLSTAVSEKIVPAGHSACGHPETIQELRRILLLNAGLKP